MTALTTHQKKQIAAIPPDYHAKITALEAEEAGKVDTLLTDPQKKVLASLERFAKYVMPAFADDAKRPAAPDTSRGGPEAPPMA